MKKLKFEDDVVCPSCKGSGLYQGMAERKGCAVVCYQCDGTGKKHVIHEYEKFEKQKIINNVARVFKTAGGYGITAEDVTTKEGVTIHFSQAGATYKDWLAGKELLPIRELHCPVIHFGQGTPIGEWFKGHDVAKRNKIKYDITQPECGWEFTKCKEINTHRCWAFYDAHKEEFNKLK